MQEAHIDHSELDRLVERLAKSPQVLQEAKRRAMEAAAPKLCLAVRAEIGGSGKVQSWQEAYVGSEGGYAAARPRAKTYIETKGKRPSRDGPKKYAVGYVTNAVNNGHRTPRNKFGYRTSAGVIAGKEFYQRAQAQAETVARDAAQQITQALTDHLGG